MEYLVILLVMGGISLFNWLAKKSEELKNERAESDREEGTGSPNRGGPQTTAPFPGKSEEERLREFMEALGLPQKKPEPKPVPKPQTQPPPIPVQRRVEPARQPIPTRRPTRTAPPLPAPVAPSPVARKSPEPTRSFPSTRSAPSDLPTADAYDIVTASQREATVPALGLRRILESPSGFRSAILTNEILRPPRALRQSDDLPGLL